MELVDFDNPCGYHRDVIVACRNSRRCPRVVFTFSKVLISSFRFQQFGRRNGFVHVQETTGLDIQHSVP